MTACATNNENVADCFSAESETEADNAKDSVDAL